MPKGRTCGPAAAAWAFQEVRHPAILLPGPRKRGRGARMGGRGRLCICAQVSGGRAAQDRALTRPGWHMQATCMVIDTVALPGGLYASGLGWRAFTTAISPGAFGSVPRQERQAHQRQQALHGACLIRRSCQVPSLLGGGAVATGCAAAGGVFCTFKRWKHNNCIVSSGDQRYDALQRHMGPRLTKRSCSPARTAVPPLTACARAAIAVGGVRPHCRRSGLAAPVRCRANAIDPRLHVSVKGWRHLHKQAQWSAVIMASGVHSLWCM